MKILESILQRSAPVVAPLTSVLGRVRPAWDRVMNSAFVRDAWNLDASMSTPAPHKPSFGEAAREPRSFGARILPAHVPPLAASPLVAQSARTRSEDTHSRGASSDGELNRDLVC